MSRVLIAAHRGLRGGNLVENTLPAFAAALSSGADILETDLKQTLDGEIVLFHDLDVHRLLPTLHGPVRGYTLRELRCFGLRNCIGEDSGSKITTLRELLDFARGNCLLNLDQCEGMISASWKVIREYGMQEQVLFKGAPPFDDILEELDDCDDAPAFIPVLRTAADIEAFRALPKRVRVPMVEVIFKQESDSVFSAPFRAELAARGIRLWVNALDLGKGLDMCAGHNDTVSVTGQPRQGWGWLIEKGVGAIQTDFPAQLREYIQTEGLL